MKKLFLLTIISVVVSVISGYAVFAQISEGGTPPSFTELKSFNEIDLVNIMPPDMEAVMREDIDDEKNGTMYKVARLLDVDLSMDNSGTWSELNDGTQIWQLRIKSKDARGIALHFSKFNIPDGAKFFVYKPDRSVILGAFTSYNNSGNEATSIGLLPGDEIIVEYVAPRATAKTMGFKKTSEPDFHIFRISYMYRGMELFELEQKGTGYGASDDCMVDVNCSEGANWQIQKKGVARIYTVQGMYGGYCTGTLVNNTANNGTPYFLTADHCGGTATTNEFNQWVFYFNWEAAGCNNSTSSPPYNSMTGCSRKARSPLNGGSDFLLLQLNNTPPSNYGVIYNGWNRANTASSSGVSIHHPSGDIKKISTYTSNLVSTTYNGGAGNIGATGAHWRVVWAATTNGHGVTEQGSSGSPIFDSNGRVNGTLSGGSSYCDATTSPDLYGKFYYHWDQYGSVNADKLKPWLDPQGTNPTTLDYYNPNSTTLNANFTASPTTVTAGGTVSFTNTSTGSPTGYSWSFPGGSPSTSTAVNPSVVYNTVGSYNVSLTVTSGANSDTETKNGYITVTAQGSGFSLDFESCTDFQVDNFTPWTTYDGDASGTYSINGVTFTNQNYTGSYIAFNHNATSPAAGTQWAAHGGSRCGICFAATSPPNNDWLISPQATMQSNGSFTFWAKSATDQYGLERFKVLVSTTNNSTGSFTAITSGSYVEAPTEWTQYTYSLSAYNGQSIYIAIQCVSNDAFGFMIDDIVLNTGTAAGTAPVANFVGTPTTVTAGGSVSFTDQSTNTPTQWSWSFPGGTPATSSSQNPTVVYNTPGTYNVSLTVTNAYGNNNITKNSYITVNQQTSSGFSLDFESCTDFQVDNFTPWTTYDGDASGTYSIDGVTFTNQNYTGSYIAFNHNATSPAAGTQWAAHGGSRCGICFAATDAVNNDWLISPQANMQSNGSFTFWAKSATDQYGLERFKVLVSTTNNSTGSFTAITSGSYVEAPTEWTQYTYSLSAYNGQSIYIAIQCVSNDAFGFMIDDIVLNTGTAAGTAPVANFVGTPTTVTAGGSVSFTDQSTNTPTQWSWSFPGGTPATSSSQNPTVVYNTPGTYNVSLTVSNAYGNNNITKNSYITVNQQGGNAPVANFTGTPTTLTAGGSVSFTDQSTNTPTQWSWSFQGGTPATSSSQNPSIVYNTPGTYNVSLTVTNAYGNNSITKNGYITVNQQGGNGPVADFSGTPTYLTAGNSVSFTDLSTNSPTQWSWSFPGAATTTSSQQNPTVVYNTPGMYNVSLTVTNAYGNNSITKTNYIKVVAPVTSFSLDFEDCTDFQVDNFSPWTTLDNDGMPTNNLTETLFDNQNYTGSFIAFNHTATTPQASDDYAPHGGERCGICMPLAAGSNNDWLISPQITLGSNAMFSFWAKSVSYNGLGSFRVFISTSVPNPNNFIMLSSGSSVQAPTVWTLFNYNLNAYAGQTVYLAIQCSQLNSYGLMLDDIDLVSATGIQVSAYAQMQIYPNPNQGSFALDAGEFADAVQLQVYNVNGQTMTIEAQKSGNVFYVDMGSVANGMYFVKVSGNQGTRTFKMSVIR